jgi:molybdopterin molybdotransferase
MMLRALADRAGARSVYLGIAPDDAESLRGAIEAGLRDADVVVLSGGVSAGKFDLVPGVLRELGVEGHFHQVLLKPGKPLFFGTWNQKLVFGLPGNPVSSFVCFELFIRPVLRKMRGVRDHANQAMALPLTAAFRTDNDRPTFWPGLIERSDGAVTVRALPWKGSADLRALHGANALLALKAGAIALDAGQLVEVIALDGS